MATQTEQVFRRLESDGLARIRAELDTDVDISWMDDDQRAGWDGEAWGTIAEVRPDTDSAWEHVDSVWGHIGYRNVLDPNENVYMADHMSACVGWHADRLEREHFASSPAGAD